jgi:diguanylate cyclase (GGDEF)-like protein
VVLKAQFLNDKLEVLEQQINRYQGLLSSGFKKLQFPKDIEKDYDDASNSLFIDSSRLILSFGVLLYLVFGFVDYALAEEQAGTLWVIRLLVAGVMLLAISVMFNRRLVRWVIKLTSLGMVVVGLSSVGFLAVVDEPYAYAYHLGLIPWQVFVLVVLRTNLRAITINSVIVYIAYILVSVNKDFLPYHPEVDQLVIIMLPLFSVFWGVLILMGIYLGYELEKTSRIAFVKYRLLSLDTQRLTLLGEELHLLSTTDSLTGLANRRHFENCFDSEWRRAIRTQDSIALIMIDIDHFKKYNDRYGHQAGDDCLRQVCDALKDYAQRSGELIGRYGGEEFVVLLPRMTLVRAQVLAESMCRRIASLNIEHGESMDNKVTISIGIAAMVPSMTDESANLLRIADRCLYRAKADGRNRVVS